MKQPKTIREIKCDHAIEDAIKHPAMEYVNIGNLIIAMCGTCHNALRAQMFADLLPYIDRTIQHIDNIVNNLRLPEDIK